MDAFVSLLIICPFLEIYLLYTSGAHLFIFRALKQYYDLNPDERKFIKAGILQELRIVSIFSLITYLLALLMDYLTYQLVPDAIWSLLIFLITLATHSNSFQNGNERRRMKRLQGVIIQLYLLLTVSIITTLTILLGPEFLSYLPVPPVAYLDLHSTDNEKPHIWFTLSSLFIYTLPGFVYIGISFYLANFCFLLCCRMLYYAFQKRFWWSIEQDEYYLLDVS